MNRKKARKNREEQGKKKEEVSAKEIKEKSINLIELANKAKEYMNKGMNKKKAFEKAEKELRNKNG